jgi:predicted GNAT superfamily acetyltransferase
VSTEIRPVRRADLPAVRALNAANVPAVGPLDDDRVELFLTAAEAFWVAVADDAVVGLFVGLLAGHDYASPNYRWFAQRNERFAYVDRIALAPEARGSGLADTLYDRWEEVARSADVAVLCAEVNTVPPNPRSLAFHRRRGVLPVAEVAPYGDDRRVAMLQKDL